MQGDDFQVIFIHQGEHFQVIFIHLDVTLLMFCSPVKCFTNFFKILGLLAEENESQGPEMPDYLCQVTGPRSKHRLTRFFATISHLSKSRKGNLDILGLQVKANIRVKFHLCGFNGLGGGEVEHI